MINEMLYFRLGHSEESSGVRNIEAHSINLSCRQYNALLDEMHTFIKKKHFKKFDDSESNRIASNESN